ncbi:hypothetical protein PMZ80_002466 [Knufia obscura]|uniref:Uncharacterized protein n=1 Tax=Knufia obscura TaxID=1635080 RepID=A0ABR0RXX1_9EURO|nr:hypothetical protein PMZ80_002466 [Knufia obscura]
MSQTIILRTGLAVEVESPASYEDANHVGHTYQVDVARLGKISAGRLPINARLLKFDKAPRDVHAPFEIDAANEINHKAAIAGVITAYKKSLHDQGLQTSYLSTVKATFFIKQDENGADRPTSYWPVTAQSIRANQIMTENTASGYLPTIVVILKANVWRNAKCSTTNELIFKDNPYDKARHFNFPPQLVGYVYGESQDIHRQIQLQELVTQLKSLELQQDTDTSKSKVDSEQDSESDDEDEYDDNCEEDAKDAEIRKINIIRFELDEEKRATDAKLYEAVQRAKNAETKLYLANEKLKESQSKVQELESELANENNYDSDDDENEFLGITWKEHCEYKVVVQELLDMDILKHKDTETFDVEAGYTLTDTFANGSEEKEHYEDIERQVSKLIEVGYLKSKDKGNGKKVIFPNPVCKAWRNDAGIYFLLKKWCTERGYRIKIDKEAGQVMMLSKSRKAKGQGVDPAVVPLESKSDDDAMETDN